jgi:lipopolysaccharide/colanic/teichoic acid biosynthesis glycosyltransferase
MLSLRPGITGPASLKYSNEEELLANQPDPLRYNDEVLFPDKVRINLHYIKTRSMWMDLGIIVFTLLRRKPMERWVESGK